MNLFFDLYRDGEFVRRAPGGSFTVYLDGRTEGELSDQRPEEEGCSVVVTRSDGVRIGSFVVHPCIGTFEGVVQP